MAKTIFNEQNRQQLEQRIAHLTPTNERQFGKMTPSQMVCHLIDSLRVSTGQVPAASRKSFLANPVLRWLVIYHAPWPKGKAPTAPEMLVTQPATWDADITTLREQLSGAVARGAKASWAEHPAFGNISGKDYGVLIHRHFEHHLGQFGV